MVTLEELTRAHGWLNALRPLPWQITSELHDRYQVDLTHHSTALEGNTLTKSETQIVIEKGITIAGKPLIDHLEVVGHKEALDFVIELAEADSVLTEWEIRNIHSLVMKGQGQDHSGTWRRLDVKAAGTDYSYPSHLKIPEMMSIFTAWLAADDGLHPVLKASETHLRFVTIHPFQDGNGRVGRLLLNLLLIQHGYPLAVIPTSSRPEYIASLELAQSEGSREQLDALIFKCLKETFIDTFRTTLSYQDLVIEKGLKSEISEWIA